MTTTTRIQIGSALLLATLAACSTGPDTGVSVQLALCGGDDVCPGQEEQPPAEQPPQAPQVGCVLFMIRDVELEAVTAELLPAAVRDGFGLRDDAGSRRLAARVWAGARLITPRLPGLVRFAPAYTQAVRRLAGRPPSSSA